MVDYQWAGFATGCCVMFVGLYFMAPVAEEPNVVRLPLSSPQKTATTLLRSYA